VHFLVLWRAIRFHVLRERTVILRKFRQRWNDRRISAAQPYFSQILRPAAGGTQDDRLFEILPGVNSEYTP